MVRSGGVVYARVWSSGLGYGRVGSGRVWKWSPNFDTMLGYVLFYFSSPCPESIIYTRHSRRTPNSSAIPYPRPPPQGSLQRSPNRGILHGSPPRDPPQKPSRGDCPRVPPGIPSQRLPQGSPLGSPQGSSQRRPQESPHGDLPQGSPSGIRPGTPPRDLPRDTMMMMQKHRTQRTISQRAFCTALRMKFETLRTLPLNTCAVMLLACFKPISLCWLSNTSCIWAFGSASNAVSISLQFHGSNSAPHSRFSSISPSISTELADGSEVCSPGFFATFAADVGHNGATRLDARGADGGGGGGGRGHTRTPALGQ